MKNLVATTGGASTRYVQVGGQILAQYESGAWAYVTPDALPVPVAPRPLAWRPGRAGPDGTGQAQVGSVRQLADTDGQVTLAQSYDPFGVLLEANGSGASEFGYTGEWWDSYTQFVFLRARWYDPASGRFITQDPWLGDPFNPRSLPPSYLYASGNPINRIDPSGQASIHFEVVLRYAARYGFTPEYVIPTTVPPNQPSWARWGWRIDLVDWVNFEIYEVEPYNAGAPYAAGHGKAQVQRYLDELNNSYEGVGIGYVNTWKPGRQVAPMNFITWNGFAEVDSWWNEPGVIVFEARWTQKAYDLVAEMCALTAWFLILRGAGAFQKQPLPQPGMAPGIPPYWLPPDELRPEPTPTIL